MTISYLVEFEIHRKMAYYSLQKIVLDRFPRNIFIYSAIVNDTCMQKMKIGHRAKFRDRDNFFSAGFISSLVNIITRHYLSVIAREAHLKIQKFQKNQKLHARAYDWPFNYESIVFKNVIPMVSAS